MKSKTYNMFKLKISNHLFKIIQVNPKLMFSKKILKTKELMLNSVKKRRRRKRRRWLMRRMMNKFKKYSKN